MTASQGGNSNYNMASDVPRSFAIKSAQTITFDALPGKTFGDADFSVFSLAGELKPHTSPAVRNKTAPSAGSHIGVFGSSGGGGP